MEMVIDRGKPVNNSKIQIPSAYIYFMKYVLSLLFLLVGAGVFGQEGYSSKNKKAIKHYEEALKHYNGRSYEPARQYLDKAIAEDENFIEAYMMRGYIFSDLDKPHKAIEDFKKAIAINPLLYSMNFFSLARLQMQVGNYKEAKASFEKFLEKPSENKDINKSAALGLQNCDFAIAAMQNPVPFKPINAGEGINSEYNEYFPSITADEQTFLFTRRLPQKFPGSFQEDFYVSNKKDGKWQPAYGIGKQINTEGNEGAPCLSPDGEILFFVACEGEFGYGAKREGYGSCDIFISFKNADDWTTPQNAGSPVNSKWWETQPSFSSDGKTLYFIRGVTGANGKKQMDIWTASMKESGKWSAPVKLSDKINTPYNEESVFIHPDNQTLYFSSEGHPGMGGMDIFMSRRQLNGEWGDPVNLGYPINTAGDENSFLVSRDGKTAYFASDREGGFGGLDIYYFELYEAARPGKTIYVKGKVYDAQTKLPLEADVEAIDLQTGTTVVKWVSNKKDGSFLICLPVNKNYAFSASKQGYLFNSKNFSLLENKEYQPFAVSIPLHPVTSAKDSVFVLNNVFFDTDKYNLKNESKVELDKLADFLTKNSSLKIELGGHTDNVGEKKHNQVLSENRAKAVCDYLIAKGIVKERLTYKGYGDTQPVVPNDSDEHRQMNRRTEYKVISN